MGAAVLGQKGGSNFTNADRLDDILRNGDGDCCDLQTLALTAWGTFVSYERYVCVVHYMRRELSTGGAHSHSLVCVDHMYTNHRWRINCRRLQDLVSGLAKFGFKPVFADGVLNEGAALREGLGLIEF